MVGHAINHLLVDQLHLPVPSHSASYMGCMRCLVTTLGHEQVCRTGREPHASFNSPHTNQTPSCSLFPPLLISGALRPNSPAECDGDRDKDGTEKRYDQPDRPWAGPIHVATKGGGGRCGLARSGSHDIPSFEELADGLRNVGKKRTPEAIDPARFTPMTPFRGSPGGIEAYPAGF